MSVINLVPPTKKEANADVVRVLELALASAKSGEMVGVVIASISDNAADMRHAGRINFQLVGACQIAVVHLSDELLKDLVPD